MGREEGRGSFWGLRVLHQPLSSDPFRCGIQIKLESQTLQYWPYFVL